MKSIGRASAAAIVAVLTTASTVVAANGASQGGIDLCPARPDSLKVVAIDRVEILPPASDDETTAAMAMLATGDRDGRLRAAVSLGLAGDVPAFNRLLEARDTPSLSSYGRFYVNPDGRACVAGEIEDGVLAHINDPELRPALTAFFEQNLYQRRDLFDRLIGVDFEDGRPQDFNRVVMALLATRLEGVEDEVLGQAKRYLDHDTPVRKQVLPGVHRRWVEFFGERDHVAAIGYMEALLLAEGWDETVDSFVAEFSQTRSRVYLTLNGFDSPEVAGAFIRQLGRVADRCPPEFILYEISAFGPFAVSHAATDEQKRQVGESLADLLGPGSTRTTPTRAATDYRTHKEIVELLAAVGTDDAAAVLVADLHRLTEIGDPRLAEPLIVSTLEAFRYLPESAELDVPAFLAAAAGLSDVYRLHNVPTILDAHPHPAAHAFYLDQMGWILDHWEGFQARFHVDPANALELVIDRLLLFEAPGELIVTRDAVDGLYREGKLDERRYIATSVRLNDLLGDESAVYRELGERQRIAQEAEIERKREAEAVAWRQVVDENTSPEGIRSNLQFLAPGGSRSDRAASWLVIAGAEIMEQAHQMLADPASSDESKIRLLQVVGEIGDPRSIPPVIALTRANAGNRTYLGAGLRALALMPSSATAFDFAVGLLKEDGTSLMKQQALVYLASVRDPRARDIASPFTAAEIEPDIRVAALLLAARLGDDGTRPAVVEMLESTEDRSFRDGLLRALAELSTPDAFEAFGSSNPGLGQTVSFRDLRPLVAFRHTGGETKIEVARHLVGSGHEWDRRDAVTFLVEEGHIDVLAEVLQPGPFAGQPLLKSILMAPRGIQIFAQIRRMGYRVDETPEGLVLVPDS